jgi:hypothetical protein
MVQKYGISHFYFGGECIGGFTIAYCTNLAGTSVNYLPEK